MEEAAIAYKTKLTIRVTFGLAAGLGYYIISVHFVYSSISTESQEPKIDSQEVPDSKPTQGQEADPPERNDKATSFESGDDAATADLKPAL